MQCFTGVMMHIVSANDSSSGVLFTEWSAVLEVSTEKKKNALRNGFRVMK